MTSDANRANELAVEIRPGVFRPDWSLVTTEAARQALAGRMAGSAGLLEHWSKPIHPLADLVLSGKDGAPLVPVLNVTISRTEPGAAS
jgi:alkylmercury lyase